MRERAEWIAMVGQSSLECLAILYTGVFNHICCAELISTSLYFQIAAYLQKLHVRQYFALIIYRTWNYPSYRLSDKGEFHSILWLFIHMFYAPREEGHHRISFSLNSFTATIRFIFEHLLRPNVLSVKQWKGQEPPLLGCGYSLSWSDSGVLCGWSWSWILLYGTWRTEITSIQFSPLENSILDMGLGLFVLCFYLFNWCAAHLAYR